MICVRYLVPVVVVVVPISINKPKMCNCYIIPLLTAVALLIVPFSRDLGEGAGYVPPLSLASVTGLSCGLYRGFRVFPKAGHGPLTVRLAVSESPEFPPVWLHLNVKPVRIQFPVSLITGFQPVYFRVVEHSRYSWLESSGTHADTHLNCVLLQPSTVVRGTLRKQRR